MKKSLTLFLFFLLSGNFACTDDYDFRPYEPEKSTVQELTLLKYNFLADGETALADFSMGFSLLSLSGLITTPLTLMNAA